MPRYHGGNGSCDEDEDDDDGGDVDFDGDDGGAGGHDGGGYGGAGDHGCGSSLVLAVLYEWHNDTCFLCIISFKPLCLFLILHCNHLSAVEALFYPGFSPANGEVRPASRSVLALNSFSCCLSKCPRKPVWLLCQFLLELTEFRPTWSLNSSCGVQDEKHVSSLALDSPKVVLGDPCAINLASQ